MSEGELIVVAIRLLVPLLIFRYQLTGARAAFAFPNLFENWWLYVVVIDRFWPRPRPHSARSVAVPMVLLLIPKLAQEHLIHVAEAEPWDWSKKHLPHIS